MIPESSKVRRNRRLIFGVTAGAVFLLGLWSLCEWCFQMPAQSGPPSTGGMRPHAEASPEAVAQRSQAGDTRTAGVRRNLKGEAATGTVEVVAEYSDGSVANGVGITLRRFGMDLNVEILRTITDNAGRCGVFDAPVGDYV